MLKEMLYGNPSIMLVYCGLEKCSYIGGGATWKPIYEANILWTRKVFICWVSEGGATWKPIYVADILWTLKVFICWVSGGGATWKPIHNAGILWA